MFKREFNSYLGIRSVYLYNTERWAELLLSEDNCVYVHIGDEDDLTANRAVIEAEVSIPAIHAALMSAVHYVQTGQLV